MTDDLHWCNFFKVKNKIELATFLAFCMLNFTSHALSNSLANVETDAVAFKVVSKVVLRSEIRCEKLRLILFRDTATLIVDLNGEARMSCSPTIIFQTDSDSRILGRKLNRIVDQVDQNLLRSRLVDLNEGVRSIHPDELDFNAGKLSIHAEQVNNWVNDLHAQVVVPTLHLKLVGVEQRRVQTILDVRQ